MEQSEVKRKKGSLQRSMTVRLAKIYIDRLIKERQQTRAAVRYILGEGDKPEPPAILSQPERMRKNGLSVGKTRCKHGAKDSRRGDSGGATNQAHSG